MNVKEHTSNFRQRKSAHHNNTREHSNEKDEKSGYNNRRYRGDEYRNKGRNFHRNERYNRRHSYQHKDGQRQNNKHHPDAAELNNSTMNYNKMHYYRPDEHRFEKGICGLTDSRRTFPEVYPDFHGYPLYHCCLPESMMQPVVFEHDELIDPTVNSCAHQTSDDTASQITHFGGHLSNGADSGSIAGTTSETLFQGFITEERASCKQQISLILSSPRDASIQYQPNSRDGLAAQVQSMLLCGDYTGFYNTCKQENNFATLLSIPNEMYPQLPLWLCTFMSMMDTSKVLDLNVKQEYLE